MPAALAGAGVETEETLDRLASAWGQAYQALDDFRDLFAADRESGKTAGRDAPLGRPNLVRSLGPEVAHAALARDLGTAAFEIARLGASGELSRPLLGFTHLLEGESDRISGQLAIRG